MSSVPEINKAIAARGASNVARYNPGAVLFSEWYPAPYNTEHHVAEAINTAGKIRIASNNLTLGATSNFTISSSELIYGLCLNCSITTPANSVIGHEGWFFSLVNTVDITISNSNMSNQTISGTSMRELLLLACDSKEKRSMLLRAAGQETPAATTATATIPIGWMLSMAIGVGMGGQYPIDMSTIAGSIQINVTWNNSTSLITRTVSGDPPLPGPEPVASFNYLYLTALSSQIINPAFSVRQAMIRDPAMVYSIPGKYLTYTRYTQNMTPGTPTTLQIASAPLGELSAIVLTVKPTTELTATASGNVILPGSCRLTSLRLEYSGTVLYQADSYEEHLHYMRQKFQGDDKTYCYNWANGNSVTAATVDSIDTQVLVVPLCYDGADVMSSKNIEYLRGYSGNTLSLTLTVSNSTSPAPGARGVRTSAGSFYSAKLGPEGGLGSQPYLVECLFMVNSVMTIDSSTVNVHV